MKTTIELPDALFQTLKETAARRNTTLEEIFIHALKREIGPGAEAELPFEVDELGLPILLNPNKPVSIDLVDALKEDETETHLTRPAN